MHVSCVNAMHTLILTFGAQFCGDAGGDYNSFFGGGSSAAAAAAAASSGSQLSLPPCNESCSTAPIATLLYHMLMNVIALLL